MAISALSVIRWPWTKVLCSLSITSWRILFNLLEIVFVTTFIATLQRLIGRKSFGDERFLHFRIREIKVLFNTPGSLLLFRVSKATLIKYVPTMCQNLWKNRVGRTFEPGALRGCIWNKASLTSWAENLASYYLTWYSDNFTWTTSQVSWI